MAERVGIHFHDRCFDGASSAAVFSRFYRERINPEAEFFFHGLTHQPAGQFDDVPFAGDVNAIVDFKYSPSPRLTWWFDHHHSAFLTPEDAEHFKAGASDKKFYDPSFKSNTKFLAKIAQEKFGFDPSPLKELIEWADIIDGAQYESAEAAVTMNVPATQVALVIEASTDDDLTKRLIPDLATKSLAEVAGLPYIKNQFDPLYDRHHNSMDVMKKECQNERGVLYYDLTGHKMEGYNKFIAYFLHPDAVFSVGISSSPKRIKIGVGSNPWQKFPDDVNLAGICERYGGGGHPRVAAISLNPGEEEEGRRIGKEIAEELRKLLS